MKRRALICSVAITCLILGSLPSDAQETTRPLLRFPDIHGDTVVFVYSEDVWAAEITGCAARRLTDHEGEDRHPKISADGALIAFTSQIGGNPDVWVMRIDGSNLRRVTWHPGADEVVGWHPTTNKVMFRSNRVSFSRFDRLFLISPDGSGLEELPLHEAGRGDFTPDGGRMVYNRIAREDRTWKRYRGGMAQDLWLYDFATAEDRRLTTHPGTDRLPMWIGETLCFASDRDGPLELYRWDLESGAAERLTRHEAWDIRRPSSDGERIVYELAGDLWLYDPVENVTGRLDIEIPGAARETLPYRRSVAGDITHVQVAPAGGRALISARGEIFTVPVENGPTRNLSRTPGARERGAVWSPDGETIVWWSDADGEVDLWLTTPGGSSTPRRVSDLGPGYRHTARWSPDGKHIAFADQTLALRVLNVASGEITKVDRSVREPMDIAMELKPISDHRWSPDSRYLVYSAIGADMVSRVWIWDSTSGEKHAVSNGQFNDFHPVFAPDGKHLLFISNRRFIPTLGDFEWEMVYKEMAGIYAVTLEADGEALLPPRSDEVAAADAESPTAPPSDQVEVQIDWKGLASRVEALPIPRGNYRHLEATSSMILYLNGSDGDYNFFEFRELGPQDLMAFDLEDREQTTLRRGVDRYDLAADRTHFAWWQGDHVGIIKIKTGKMAMLAAHLEKGKEDDCELDLSGLEVEVNPRTEWRQVFDEAWRMERDFFYEPGMHGLDWQAEGQRYRRLAERATCAQDMRFVLGELIGELSTSHTYVRPGDRQLEAETVEVGLLGVDWTAEGDHWRIAKIYDVPDWSRDILPPLAGPGINVEAGDYLLAVNGADVTTAREVSAWLQGLAGVAVTLTLNDQPTSDGAREVLVTPVGSERWLRYHAWVEHNRRVVDEATDGRVGYLHFPDTYTGSATEFPKHYYSQVMKEGLIVDGRFNGGGLDPDIFLARLAKEPLSYWTRRYSLDHATPWYVSNARMVCLTNRQAGSGGDEFPFLFRAKGMGPVIGTRTWGGLVGISMRIPLMDGSMLTAPDYRVYTPEGKWTVENEGVAPDIEVELDPAEMARGQDAQLQKAIEVLQERLRNDPVPEPVHPPFPKREDW